VETFSRDWRQGAGAFRITAAKTYLLRAGLGSFRITAVEACVYPPGPMVSPSCMCAYPAHVPSVGRAGTRSAISSGASCSLRVHSDQ
jgi:hypothetical protein